jgi:hypothetical protein
MQNSIGVYGNRQLPITDVNQILKLLLDSGVRRTDFTFSKPSYYNTNRIEYIAKNIEIEKFSIETIIEFIYRGKKPESPSLLAKKAYHGLGNIATFSAIFPPPTYTRVYFDTKGDTLSSIHEETEHAKKMIEERGIGDLKELITSGQEKNESPEFIKVGKKIVDISVPNQSKKHVVLLNEYFTGNIKAMTKEEFLGMSEKDILQTFRNMSHS